MTKLPAPRVGDPYPAGASDDVNCDEPSCDREPDHPLPHVAARNGRVVAVWSES